MSEAAMFKVFTDLPDPHQSNVQRKQAREQRDFVKLVRSPINIFKHLVFLLPKSQKVGSTKNPLNESQKVTGKEI